jgi:hypothetical protein
VIVITHFAYKIVLLMNGGWQHGNILYLRVQSWCKALIIVTSCVGVIGLNQLLRLLLSYRNVLVRSYLRVYLLHSGQRRYGSSVFDDVVFHFECGSTLELDHPNAFNASSHSGGLDRIIV